jgi:hypothetical protein
MLYSHLSPTLPRMYSGIEPASRCVQIPRETLSECRQCKNYHGQRYNGTLLVCGMHPYGPGDESCEDFEKGDLIDAPSTGNTLSPQYFAERMFELQRWERRGFDSEAFRITEIVAIERASHYRVNPSSDTAPPTSPEP